MHPLKALQALLTEQPKTLSGIVVSSTDSQAVIATQQGRKVIAVSAPILPGTQVTIADGTAQASPQRVARYPV